MSLAGTDSTSFFFTLARLVMNDDKMMFFRGQKLRHHPFLAVAALACFMGVSSLFEAFSHFERYDDEGYMMLAVQHLLDGHDLYRRITLIYGPFYFAWEWFLHAILAIPNTNEAARLVGVFVRAVAGLAMGIAVLRQTGQLLLGLLACALASIHTWVLTKEPGHPQELVILVVAVFLALVPNGNGRFAWVFPWIAGIAGGLLVATKINVGVYFLAAIVSSGFAAAGGSPARRFLRFVVLAGVVALPFAISRAHLGQLRFLLFTVVVSLSVLSCLIIGSRAEWRPGLRDGASFAVGFCLSLGACLGWAIGFGATPVSLLDSLVLRPMGFSSAFAFPTPISILAIPVALGSSMLLAGVIADSPPHRWRLGTWMPRIVAFSKLSYGGWLLYRLSLGAAGGLGGGYPLLGIGIPLVWMGLANFSDRGVIEPPTPARLLTCCLAPLLVFQAFPVAGSQVFVGTLPLVWICLVCIFDGLRQLRGDFRALLPSIADFFLRAVVGLLVAGLLGVHGWRSLGLYRSGAPLGMIGTRRIRVDPHQVKTLGWLVENLRSAEQSFFCTIGLGSLHFWSGREPITQVVIGNSLDILGEADLRLIRDALDARPRVIVVRHGGFLPPPLVTRLDNPVLQYIDDNFYVYDSYDGFELLVRRGQLPWPTQPRSK